MTIRQKYNAITMNLHSIGQHTYNEYPTFNEFKTALKEGRVSGNYDKRVTIVSNNANDNFTFISGYECDCGWIGQGTGNSGSLIEGDRCPDCGNYL